MFPTFLHDATVYVVSDSVGETAEFVVRAAATQFAGQSVQIRKFPYIEDEGTLNEIIRAAAESKAIIAYTLVIPTLKAHIKRKAAEENVVAVDIMSPMVDALQMYLNKEPNNKPGLVRQLDEDYFRKVEAIEFAVKYDDGRDPRGILRADVILIGVSRTSKTPLSMYLANKRLKVANVPLVPEVEPPEELFLVPSERCIGLTINADQLNMIRTERLKSLGLTPEANYASMERIKQELEYSSKIIERVGCPVIDVSNKAVEETANIIMEIIRRNGIKK
ncbi:MULTISPECIES: pyruvate, water dikinase regulatory protein [Aneurinibacillus]|jgi:regulator of PEP synthase PpsR (kinase-PPPase family)|uniref:Putative pyruvate, phosphate dikinase regulatory protein n=1 Tax=Aneurinibacillus thermoaerophilus TaxID=143495 RepID=A0A1G7Z5G7_ANETH|nr:MULTISPECIES: pyruvate, water dikinase regulatory protein [Aneurinibacillus]AMA72366.1 phosphoenolpyruvate synthase regulatory protein [Aneurinibacillus sp. XH2]MED0674775.1 kinase/pyrophosphorylase [Aneurinibacillus thermoaerophilus]MED0679726.1 kinase/pyrophosphorylase [Aneurinibacillus thermoaerophilus]MED0735757.1 kinase/pyrophosphorylase [Aneurinibacillus thermoaerophilus]MED0757965.1 kinase/pyrophosphorylase [Aneurinibacillus thermoaerophilus]